MDTAGWTHILNICNTFENIFNECGSPICKPQDALRTLPAPRLPLVQYIEDLQGELLTCGLDISKAKLCSSIYEESLTARATEVQLSLQESWLAIGTQDADDARGALVRLHVNCFRQDVQDRRERIMQLVRGHLADGHSNDSDENIDLCQWTSEARKLMEQVYQRLPRLEQHEKKTLSEVSGLSLRQITIWVRPSRST